MSRSLFTALASPAWTPKSLGSALVTWGDPAFKILNGSNVSQLTDQSGNGNHILQATGANQPLWVSSGLNGRPTVRFDGSSSFMAAAYTLAQTFRRFFVFKMVTIGAPSVNDAVMDGNTIGSSAFAVDSTPQSYITAGTQLFTTGAYRPGASGFEQVSLLYNGNSSKIRSSRVDRASGAAGAQSAGGVTLGSLGGGSRKTNIEIAEFFDVNRDVTAGELSSIEAYFSARFGVT